MPKDLLADMEPMQDGPRDLLADMELINQGTQQPQRPFSWGDYARDSANTFANTVTGFGNAINNLPRGLANMLSPQSMQAPILKAPEGRGGELGEFLGNTASFVGGGGALNAARGAAEALPGIGRLAEMLGGHGVSGLARRALGTGLYGAAENPNDRGEGTLKGASLSVALDTLLPGAGRTVSKITGAFQPQKYTDQLVKILSSGKDIEQVGKSLAEDLKGAYKNRMQEARELYKPVFDKVGNTSLLESMAPENSIYKAVPGDIFRTYDRNLTKMHQKFTEEPTFQNAHELQSQLGAAIRKLDKADTKGTLSVADRNVMQGYQEAQQSLRSDMENFLKNKDPALAEQYANATGHYLENVVPYIENPKIAPIAKGEIENPRNLKGLFKNPEEGMEKIVEDLGPDALNKIVYAGIGKLPKNATPEQFTRAFEGLGHAGYGSYVTPELRNMVDILGGKLSRRNFLQKGAGFLGGASLVGPGSIAAELLGGAVAGAITPSILRTLQKNTGMGMGGGVNDTLQRMGQLFNYSNIKNAALANYLPGKY